MLVWVKLVGLRGYENGRYRSVAQAIRYSRVHTQLSHTEVRKRKQILFCSIYVILQADMYHRNLLRSNEIEKRWSLCRVCNG